jgi:peptidylprolyl isomerase
MTCGMKLPLRDPCRRAIIAAALGLSCAGATFPRQTRAENARSEDPWLDGKRCATDAPDVAGLRFEDVEAGMGRAVESGDTVRVHYVAQSPDGAVLHDSRASGLPTEIIIGSTKTICGFERGLLGMQPGGQRRVFVPWRLAFGEEGRSPDVQPKTDLVFVIDLYLPADPAAEHGSHPVNPTGRGRGR